MTISEGRRCALPGCYVVIEPEPDGRPQRKYCTAAHRAVARQMRREGTHRSASAPPLPLPTPPLPLPPLAPLPGAGQRRRQLAEAAARRARAMAVLGSAGLLVTGGGLMAASSPMGLPGSTVVGAPWLAATPEAEKTWAEQARVSLASLDRQLDEVNQAERSWNALPAPERADPTPSPVRALEARRMLLEQQRTTLVSELATWDSMNVADRRLADTESHVVSLDRALKEVPRNRPLTRTEADTAQQLGEQRTLRLRQRDAQRQELDNLRQGLHEAMAMPLPNDATATKAITSRVNDLVRNPSRRNGNDQSPLSGQSRRPDITSQREQRSPSRRDVGNGAPPNPGQARPEAPKGPEILASPRSPSDRGGPLAGPMNELGKNSPRVGTPQSPNAQAGAPKGQGPLGGAVDGTTKTLEHPQGQQPGQPGAPAPAPKGQGPLGGAVDGTTKTLEHPQGQQPGARPAPGESGQGGGLLGKPAEPGAKTNAGQAPGEGRRGGMLDQPLNKPVERTSQDSFIGPTESGQPKAAPAEQRKSAPAPQANVVPRTQGTGGGSGTYTNSQKAQDASRISDAVGRGNMSDMVSAAMAAKQHENQAKSSGGAGTSGSGYPSGYSGSAGGGSRGRANRDAMVDRAMSQYGMSGGASRSSGSSGSRGSSSSGRGGSGYGSSSSIGSMIQKYSSGGGGSSKSRSSGGSSSRGSGSGFGSFFGSSGGGGSKSYRSSSGSKGSSKGSSSRGSSSRGSSGGSHGGFGGFF